LSADRAGNPNPARPYGLPIVATYGWGHSQSGRFLKDFVYEGFNEDLSGQMIFDGTIELVSGSRMTDHNLPFAQTSRWIRQHEERNYPGADFPFTYQTLHDTLSGKTDGVLKKCSATQTCPKIFHIDSDFESWNGGVSRVVTDPEGSAPRQPNGLGLPDNVRAYQLSGQPHGPANGMPSALGRGHARHAPRGQPRREQSARGGCDGARAR
jgi:hypothetical protein